MCPTLDVPFDCGFTYCLEFWKFHLDKLLKFSNEMFVNKRLRSRSMGSSRNCVYSFMLLYFVIQMNTEYYIQWARPPSEFRILCTIRLFVVSLFCWILFFWPEMACSTHDAFVIQSQVSTVFCFVLSYLRPRNRRFLMSKCGKSPGVVPPLWRNCTAFDFGPEVPSSNLARANWFFLERWKLSALLRDPARSECSLDRDLTIVCPESAAQSTVPLKRIPSVRTRKETAAQAVGYIVWAFRRLKEANDSGNERPQLCVS